MPENSLFDDGAILVNTGGVRFCDETIWPDRESAVANQPGKITFILLDEELIRRYSEWPHFISTAPEIAYACVDDYLRLRTDVAAEARTLRELATKRSLPFDALEQAVDRDSQGIPLPKRALSGDRWVLLGLVKAYFTTTEGGASINKSLQVLDNAGSPVSGLYAVGQNGLGGQILWGHVTVNAEQISATQRSGTSCSSVGVPGFDVTSALLPFNVLQVDLTSRMDGPTEIRSAAVIIEEP